VLLGIPGKRDAADEFHCEVRLRAESGVGGAGFIDLSDAGMLEAGEGLRFEFETAQIPLGGEGRLNDFEGNRAAGLDLLGFVDSTHAAFSDEAEDAITAENGIGRQAEWGRVLAW
jgi:hypothetical protein